MSSYVVSKRHIDYLVTALLANERVITGLPRTPADELDYDAIGRELWAENMHSVDYRADSPAPERANLETYRYEPYELGDIYHQMRQVRFYQYQSADDRTHWHESLAHRWTSALELVLRLPIQERYPKFGVDRRAWVP